MWAEKKKRGYFPLGCARRRPTGRAPRWGREVAGLGTGMVVFLFRKRINSP